MGDDELQRMLTSPLLDDLEWLSLAYTTVTAEGLMVATRALPHGLVVINLAGIPLSSKHVSITCSLVGITGPFDETGCRDLEAPTPVPPPTWNCLTGPEFESGGICALRVSVPPTTAEFEELCQLLSVIPTLNHLYFEGVA
ncbi:MAG: uncharacterized protein KVP18_004115 [Porospora cf. gigantea A]|nr:MAG: hypothetical protein KVP18_004115 [Porospora cf. gigantea A]